MAFKWDSLQERFIRNFLHVIKAQHTTQGRGGAIIQVELRDIDGGNKLNESLRTDETVEKVYVKEKSLTCLYTDDETGNVVLIDSETYKRWIYQSTCLVNLLSIFKLYDERPMSASVPHRVACTATEAAEPIKGIGATPHYKKVLLDNGLTIQLNNTRLFWEAFRDLPGVRIRADNKVEFDPDVERVKLPSGKPLVPDYAMTFVRGTSSKPFGRLWWDETVPSVVTRAEPHNQTIVHPVQDRVITIRENARLQGFPDYYKLLGPIKERYIQVGNAVAVPVARALGYSLALALKGLSGDGPLFNLPEEFPKIADSSPEVYL